MRPILKLILQNLHTAKNCTNDDYKARLVDRAKENYGTPEIN